MKQFKLIVNDDKSISIVNEKEDRKEAWADAESWTAIGLIEMLDEAGMLKEAKEL